MGVKLDDLPTLLNTYRAIAILLYLSLSESALTCDACDVDITISSNGSCVVR